MSKFKIGERVSDGFAQDTVLDADIREHGAPDYFVKMDNEERPQYYEESFLEKEKKDE